MAHGAFELPCCALWWLDLNLLWGTCYLWSAFLAWGLNTVPWSFFINRWHWYVLVRLIWFSNRLCLVFSWCGHQTICTLFIVMFFGPSSGTDALLNMARPVSGWTGLLSSYPQAFVSRWEWRAFYSTHSWVLGLGSGTPVDELWLEPTYIVFTLCGSLGMWWPNELQITWGSILYCHKCKPWLNLF